MTVAVIAGLRWADRSNLSTSDRNRVVLLMHLLDRAAGPAPALLLGRHQVRRLAPPPPSADTPPPTQERPDSGKGEGGAESPQGTRRS